jgi:hypothetical protein
MDPIQFLSKLSSLMRKTFTSTVTLIQTNVGAIGGKAYSKTMLTRLPKVLSKSKAINN